MGEVGKVEGKQYPAWIRQVKSLSEMQEVFKNTEVQVAFLPAPVDESFQKDVDSIPHSKSGYRQFSHLKHYLRTLARTHPEKTAVCERIFAQINQDHLELKNGFSQCWALKRLAAHSSFPSESTAHWHPDTSRADIALLDSEDSLRAIRSYGLSTEYTENPSGSEHVTPPRSSWTIHRMLTRRTILANKILHKAPVVESPDTRFMVAFTLRPKNFKNFLHFLAL